MNEKEIGGYFGLEAFSGQEYYGHLIKVNNARNALLYVLKARNIRKLLIPYFLCDCISDLCDRYDITYEYYHIGKDFLPQAAHPLSEGQWLYVVNYYGQISNEKAQELKELYKNIIFDNVQAFFQQPPTGIDTIYSCRKFFGVPDGGYLSTDTYLTAPLFKDISKDRMKHILGRFEGSGSEYYADFQESDERFYSLELREMSALTQNILRGIDYEYVRQKRNKNYAVLADALSCRNGIVFTAPDGPYCYPFYCPNGAETRRHLVQRNIYIPTLWPNVLKADAPIEQDYARNILPLPCDQRYDAADMERIIKEVMECTG